MSKNNLMKRRATRQISYMSIFLVADVMNQIKNINIIFLMTVLTAILAALLPLDKITDNQGLQLLISQTLYAFPSIIYLVTQKIPYHHAVRFKKIQPSNIVLLVVFSVLMIPVMSFLNAISMTFATNTTTQYMNGITSTSSLLVSLLTVALIPAIFEESVYRGVIYNGYRKVCPLAAIFLSAFLFGMMHGNLNQFFYAFAMGIIFALVIEATDSVLSTMIVHFCINGSSVLLMSLIPKLIGYLERVYNNAIESGDTTITQSIESLMGGSDFSMNSILESSANASTQLTIPGVIAEYGFIAIVCFILAVIVYRTIAKNSGRWEVIKGIFKQKNQKEIIKNNESVKKSLITLPLLIAVGILLLLIISNELAM